MEPRHESNSHKKPRNTPNFGASGLDLGNHLIAYVITRNETIEFFNEL